MKTVKNQAPEVDLELKAELLEDEVVEMLEGDV
jgi:hypothetical protein